MRTLIVLLTLGLLCLGQQTTNNGFASRDQRYRLQPNDVVEVQFRYTPEFNTTATIQPDGYITSSIAGQVHVGGMTLTEAADAITKEAGARLKDPEVIVFLKDFVKPNFVVAGEVAHPGTFELRGDIGIIQAIAMSGGFKDSARRTQVVLVRKYNAQMAEVKVFDVRKLMSPKNIREDITLRPGDMLVVPRNNLSKLEPYIHISSLGAYGLSAGVP